MSDLPDGIHDFLAASGWPEPVIVPLAGDASFRSYYRIGEETARQAGHGTARCKAMLMHAPPPHEDTGPFLQVTAWLAAQGHRAPEIFATDPANGYVLMEDFGDDRMRDWLERNPQEEYATYRGAIDALVRLHASPPGPFDPYDIDVYQREAGLFTEWFCPLAGLTVNAESYRSAWDEALAPLCKHQRPGITVLRDYHSENIMLLAGSAQGLIDYQDALVGHPAYDLVSLLQDARRDVSPALERAMLDHYLEQAPAGPDFEADYAILGAQRNAKIVGIFARLWKRDGKPRYLPMIPRVWEALERDLAHPALAPVAQWFIANIPPSVREQRGEQLA